MKRARYVILFISFLILIMLGLILHKNYPIFEANYYNRDISISGVKLLMTEDELNRTLEKGEFVYGMGGNGWRFSDAKLFVMTSSIGLFENKVSLIETVNSSHSILGIKVGENYSTALTILAKHGFEESSEDLFTKGNMQIQLFGGSEITKLKISILDPAYKDVVF